MSYAENILLGTTLQANQTDGLAKELGVTPQQDTAPIPLPEARQLEIKENSDPLEPYFKGFDEGRTGESVAEAAGQNSAQGTALDVTGVRQDVDANATLLGQRAGKDVKVNVGQQEKHITGTNNYNQSVNRGINRSILSEDAQNLLDEFAGKGQKIGTNKERVNFGKVIGQYYDASTGKYVDTTSGIIHYDASGKAHIVPARP